MAATPLIISTTVAGLGVNANWNSNLYKPFGALYTLVPTYIAGQPNSWTVTWSGTQWTATSFGFTTEPASWAALGGSALNFTIYWTDINGNPQFSGVVNLTPSASTAPRTWTLTTNPTTPVNSTNASIFTGTQVGTAINATYPFNNLAISPEAVDASVIVPGSASSPALQYMFVMAQRNGMVILKDASSGKIPFVVGNLAGTVWPGGASGSDPIYTLASHTGCTNAVFSCADTNTLGNIYVGYYTN